MLDRKKIDSATREEMVVMFRRTFTQWRNRPLSPEEKVTLERTIKDMEEKSNKEDCCIHFCSDCETMSAHDKGPCDHTRIVRCGCVPGTKPWSPG